MLRSKLHRIINHEVFEDILKDWLVTSDLGRLDAALAEKELRKRYLSLLTLSSVKQPPLLRLFVDHKGSKGLLSWICSREIDRVEGSWRLSLESFEFLQYSPQTEKLLGKFTCLTISHPSGRTAGLNMTSLSACVSLQELQLENLLLLHSPTLDMEEAMMFLPLLHKTIVKSCMLNEEFICLLGSLSALQEVIITPSPLYLDSCVDKNWYLSYLSKLSRLNIYDEQLEHLYYGYEQLDAENTKVTEVAIECESMSMPMLKDFLGFLPHITRVMWTSNPPSRLLTSLQLPALETLVVNRVVLSPSLFEAFSSCPALQIMEIENVKLVDNSLRESNFAANLLYSKLHTLRLFYCQSDTVLWDHLRCSHFALLLHLSFHTCRLMSFESYELFEHCHLLQSLTMQSCMVYSLPTLLNVLKNSCDHLQKLVLRNVIETKSIEYHGNQRYDKTWPDLHHVEHVQIVPSILNLQPLDVQYRLLFNEGWCQLVTELVLIVSDVVIAAAAVLEWLDKGGFPRMQRLKILSGGEVPDKTSRGQFKRMLKYGILEEIEVIVMLDEKCAQDVLDGGDRFIQHAYTIFRRK